MFTSRNSFLILAATGFVLPFMALADPPAKKVPPLADLIAVLKDGTRGEQEKAAVAIRDNYDGKCLEAIPQMVASLGRELNVRYDTPNKPPNSCYLAQHLGQASHRAGPKRFPQLFEMTTDKDPLIRAGAFRMLWAGSEDYLRRESEWKDEKSELDMAEFLKALQRGAKDESPTVRGQVMIALRAFMDADEKLSVPAAELLAAALEDREEIENKYHESPARHAAGTLMGFKAKAKPAQDALLKAVEKEDRSVVWEGSMALGRLAKEDAKVAEQAIKLFREKLTDTKRPDGIRMSAAGGLAEMGRAAKPGVKDLAAILGELKLSEKLRNHVYESLYALGPTSADAVPALVSCLEKSDDRNEHFRILNVIGEIGPAAEKAVKPLEEWAKSNTKYDQPMADRVTRTLSRIK